MRRALRLDDFDLAQLSDGAANRLRREQIRGAIEQMRVFVAGNTFFAPVLSLQAWGAGVDGLVIAWTAVVLLFSWWLFFRWTRSYETEGHIQDMNRFVAETRWNALTWCLGMVLFFPVVSGDQKTIIMVVMTGSLALATIGFASAPRAAFWYCGITVCVAIGVTVFTGLAQNNSTDFMIAALAFVAALAICNTVMEHARAQMMAFRNHEHLAQKTETIDLLLQDYEQQSVEWLWSTDPRGRIVNWPERMQSLVGEDNSVHDLSLLDVLARHTMADGVEGLSRIAAAIQNHRDIQGVTLPVRSKGSEQTRWITVRGRPQFDRGRFTGFRGIFADATVRIEAQKQVEFLARNDSLTGILNRNSVHDQLSVLDETTDRASVYLLDLDGFKQVNDSYGHPVGDELLRLVAVRIMQVVGDDGIVARLGGDEFFIMVSPPNPDESFSEACLGERLLAAFVDPFNIDRYEVTISCSIGTARFPNDTTDGPNLLNLADLSLYAAKNGGRNRCVPFVPKMQTGLQKKKLLTDRLRHAIEHHQVVPFFQPQFCAQTSQLIGFEALARWKDSRLGVVGPDIFISIAEETGLIHKMGESLLKQACAEAATWPVPADAPPLRLSVNVSPVEVQRGGLLHLIEEALTTSGLRPDQLEVEITESVLIDDIEATLNVLQRLSDLGISIALDDFGTGYSSFSYLRALPLNRLKIDRSFVQDLDTPETVSVVNTIIRLSHALGFEVVAEGVENAEAAAVLADLNCDVLQGYHFSRPLAARDLTVFFDGPTTTAA